MTTDDDLRRALDAWEKNGAPNRRSLAAFGIRVALAARSEPSSSEHGHVGPWCAACVEHGRSEPREEGRGQRTECSLEGVHEHAFRGPHVFDEWYAATPPAEGLREHGEHDNHHHYRLECEVCGQPGSVNVVIQPDYVREEAAATPRAEGLDDIIAQAHWLLVMEVHRTDEAFLSLLDRMLPLVTEEAAARADAALAATPPADDPDFRTAFGLDATPPAEGLDVERLATWLEHAFGPDVDWARHPEPMTRESWLVMARAATRAALAPEQPE